MRIQLDLEIDYIIKRKKDGLYWGGLGLVGPKMTNNPKRALGLVSVRDAKRFIPDEIGWEIVRRFISTDIEDIEDAEEVNEVSNKKANIKKETSSKDIPGE